jgi:hypothetical protein
MEAYKWVASDDHSWPYSFVSLCDALDVAPEWLRPRLLNETGVVEETKPQAPLAVEEAA